MDIVITSALARARTEIAAYDRALVLCGIADANVVPIGPMIPPGCRIIEMPDIGVIRAAAGFVVYAVCADNRVSTPGTEAWAGIGWVQDRRTGRGLIVAHEGSSEQTVAALIQASLEDMQATRGTEFGPIRQCVVGGTCRNEAICALAVAVFADQPRRHPLE